MYVYYLNACIDIPFTLINNRTHQIDTSHSIKDATFTPNPSVFLQILTYFQINCDVMVYLVNSVLLYLL